MKVNASGIEASLGYKGIDLRIANNDGKLIGTLRIGQARVEWRPAWSKKHFKAMGLEDFIDQHLDTLPDRK